MKRYVHIYFLCALLLLSGCSQEKADSSSPTKVGDTPSMSAPSKEQTLENENGWSATSPEEETAVIKAIRSIYNRPDESIVIYEEIPFADGCKLVLADRLMDGEHYPNLHLVSPEGRVLAVTRHSYCWTLNYTQFGGYRIFFGLARRETYQYGESSLPVKRIEAVYTDRTEAVDTRQDVIAKVNPKQKDTRMINSTGAYILPVKDPAMPEHLYGVFPDGRRLSLSQISVDRSLDYMPEYFKGKKRNVYNAFAFTYSPMLSPEEWKRIDAEGETALHGKTDGNGNLNAIYLRPSPAVFKTIHASEIPDDIKSFCLSNSFPWTAAFSAGESVETAYSKESQLYDCRVIKLTPQTVDTDFSSKDFQVLRVDETNHVILPRNPGAYLFVLRTEKYSELRSYAGVITIR